jgi:putative heme-binding domain-containing protein
MRLKSAYFLILFTVALAISGIVAAEQPAKAPAKRTQLFEQKNLMAWCIVPFDSKKRGPEERAAMLEKLGFTQFAYDYRAEHIPTFDDEVTALHRHKVELSAWWFPGDLNAEARGILDVLKRHKVKAQLWVTGGGGPTKNAEEQAARVKAEAARIHPIAEEAAKIGCSVGLYNHGGWFGEPENQLAIIEELKLPNVGIVYNQHHGHDHLDRFPELLKKMLPHLYVLNLNGMMPDGERRGQKIIPLGQGELDLKLLKVIAESGYQGPIGILGHTQDDAELRLQDNLDGLAWLVKQLDGKDPGPRPKPRTPVPAATPPKTTDAAPVETPGWLIAGRKEYREPPLTVECLAKFTQKGTYNILVASDTKPSGRHWEIFSMAGSGTFTAYLPGYQPDHVTSTAHIADGQWHEVAMQLATDRVKLFVDGKEVANQAVKSRGAPGVDGNLAIGRVVEGGIGSEGEIAWVRLTLGIGKVRQPDGKPPVAEEKTTGLWILKDAAKEIPDGSMGKNPARPTATGGASFTPLGLPAEFLADKPGSGSTLTGHAHHGGHTDASPPLLSSFPVEFDPKLVADLVASAKKDGNARRGLVVFRAAKFACLSCHQAGKFGGAVGPALTDAGKRLKPEELAEAVLWPKRLVKPEFITWLVQLDDGRSLQGYKKKESPSELTLFDPATQMTHVLPKDEIVGQKEVGTLMPDGLAAAMSGSQRRDLLRFMMELGVTPKLEDEVRPEDAPADFVYTRDPLNPAAWPLWQHSVNRDRLYDFYLKEALFFRQQSHRPHLLPAFPGLDGGKLGHWGNQNEEVWKDGRWNDVDLGSVLCGAFHGPNNLVVPKGVCVRIGEQGEMGVCFNPETLSYEAVWRGKFLKFSAVRHGFMDGLVAAGEFVPLPRAMPLKEQFDYHGFYRSGSRVVFAYRLSGVEMLDSPWVKDGRFERLVGPAETHPLKKSLKGSPAQWPQELKVAGKLGSGKPYVVDTIPFPVENPWKSLFFIGDHDFLPDGSALLCTMHGDVWRVSGLDADLKNVRWRRFASGLHQPLGMVVHDGNVYVLGRDQITRLKDLNNDGEADFYECVSNAMITSPAGHDFTCGLLRDKSGKFYTASGKQGLIRISADGKKVDVLATGFRNPDGLGLCNDGAITVPCSEGEWTPSSMICLVNMEAVCSPQNPPPHFGYLGPQNGQPPSLPLVYLPRGLDNSSGGQVTVPDDRWGPLQGQLVHLSFGQGSHYLVLRDEVAGQPQGAVVPLVGEFRSGAHRGKFSPRDGQLYVSGMAGWGSYTPDDGCFQRVRYTGEPVQLPRSFHIHENGILVSFTQPIDPKQAAQLQNQFAEAWNYRYGPGYGSSEMAPSHPNVVGHEALDIAGVHIVDRDTIFVELPDLQPVNQLHFVLQVDAGKPQELFITAHKLDKPFTSFPGYQKSEKIIAAHPQAVDLASLGKRMANPWGEKRPFKTKLEIAAGKNLTFSTRTLRVKAGEKIKLSFSNPDVVPHNWVLVKPGTLAKVGDLANKLIADPEAVMRHYVPKSPDVLAYTDIVSPQDEFSIFIEAPQEKGRYPYLCTFPGHWMVMNGELIVE